MCAIILGSDTMFNVKHPYISLSERPVGKIRSRKFRKVNQLIMPNFFPHTSTRSQAAKQKSYSGYIFARSEPQKNIKPRRKNKLRFAL